MTGAPKPVASPSQTIGPFFHVGPGGTTALGHLAPPGTPGARIRLATDDRRDGYTIVRLATARPGFAGDTFVHVARDPGTGAPRVIGVWRR